MDKIELEIIGITYSQTQSGSYVLTLAEKGGKRKLPIVIGGFEAQAIAVELEKMVPNRPLTHDLFKSFCISFNVFVEEVIIYKFHEGVFFAKIICNNNGKIAEIDSRTSDAIAIGVRFDCPIYTVAKVMEEVGNQNEDDTFSNIEEEENDITESINEPAQLEIKKESVEDLKERLADALENEDYELASKIRDEINRRKK